MADINDTNFVIFLIIYMMVIGIVSSVFNPAMYSFGTDDYIEAGQFQEKADDFTDPDEPENEPFWQPIADFFAGTFTVVGSIFMFLWAGFTLNIPSVPIVIRALMCSPIWGGLAWILAKYIRG